MGRSALAIAAFACTTLLSGRASAQACCTATAADEFAVVPRCHDAVFAAQLSYERALGSFDAQSRYRPLGDSSVGTASLTLGGGVRLVPRALQLGASLPIVLSHRRLEGLDSDLAAGTGDANVALRFTAVTDRIEPASLDDPSTLLPYVDLIAGTRLPTGRAPEHAELASGADATGTGAWTPFAGVKLSKFLSMSNVVALDLRYAHPLSRDVAAPGGQRRVGGGEEITLRGSWLHLHDLFWNFGLFTEWTWTAPRSEDGDRVPDSDARRARIGGHVGHMIVYPNLELTLSVAADAFFDGPSKNVPYAGPAAGITLTRHL